MDKYIKQVLNEIEKNGFEAYIVGGYVRDYLLGIHSTDIDICTNARPKDLINIFKSSTMSNSEYGSFKIQTSKYTFDITTYRKEQKYVNRRPTEIEYVNNLLTDIERRDFTINTICMSQEGDIIDILNGRKDLQNKIIRCVGNIKDKLTEDPLRILRAVRFSITLNFKLDSKLQKEIVKNKRLINTLSFTRKRAELDRILTSPYVKEGLELLKRLGIYELLDIQYQELVPVEDICAMYSQLQVSDKYPFTKNEKYIIESVRKITNKKVINKHTLYEYGVYINTLAGRIINVDTKTVNKIYESLPITTPSELKIDTSTICHILNIKPSKLLKTIQKELIYHILEGNINNEQEELICYLINNKGRWGIND